MTLSLCSLAVLSCVCIWLDIINIPFGVKKGILGLLLICACICGCYEFPESADFSVYLDLYYEPSSDVFEFPAFQVGKIDYGFFWLWTFVKSLHGSVYDAYFVTCTITMILYYKGICRCTKYIYGAWAIILVRLYYVYNIVQIRQGLASAILIYSFKYIEEKNFRAYLTCVFLATLFHQTFIVTILIYPFSLIKWTKVKCLLFMLVSLMFALIDAGDMMIKFAGTMGYGFEKLMMYSGSVFFEEPAFYGIATRLMAIVFFMYYLLKWEKPYANCFVGMLALGFFFTVTFSSYQVMQRLGNNFLLCLNFVATYFFYESNNLGYRMSVVIVIEIIFMLVFAKNYLMVTV